MNGGGGAMAAGICMMVLGVALTVVSYATASPGGTYIVFVGLMAGGFVTFIRGAATPSAGGYNRTGGRVRSTGRAGYETHAGPARVPRENYVALPGMMPAGYCWACGRKVRKGNIICYGCGAAQVSVPPEPSGASLPEMPYEGGTYGGTYAGTYDDGRQPGMPYPGGPYPGMLYPRNPYPGMPYHDSPYPGRSYPGNRYPSGPYPSTPSPRRPRSRGPRPNAPPR